MLRRILVVFVVLASLAVSTTVFAQNLTGKWTCDDGGIYYIRQIGSDIYWYGEKNAANPNWANTAVGVLVGDTLVLKWADVPKGTIMQNGELHLKVISQNTIQAVKKTGGFGGSKWTR